jgi:hypothetical protein
LLDDAHALAPYAINSAAGMTPTPSMRSRKMGFSVISWSDSCSRTMACARFFFASSANPSGTSALTPPTLT